jgi:hypothetical protein
MSCRHSETAKGRKHASRGSRQDQPQHNKADAAIVAFSKDTTLATPVE